MEVMIPSQNLDFDFNSARSSPYVSPPSTPKRFGEYYFSAPTSPSHLSQFYKDFDEMLAAASDQSGGGLTSTVPFDWEEKPGTPKSSPVVIRHGDDFAFDVMSQDWETASLSAEELFDGGVIKPLKPPPRLQLPQAARISGNVASSPGKQVSQTRKIIQGAFSPRHKSKGSADPFAVAAAKAAAPPQRGRERGGILSKSSSRRAARSLSPLRDTKYPWEEEKGGEEEDEEKDQRRNAKNSSASSSVCSALSAATKGQRKWRLKDFFLFRSASEGRAADKDPLKKYTAAFSRRSSFSVIESPRSGSRRRGPVSAHELHYTVNRAVSEDLKKKTFLPYKQGILGRLAFNPAVHALANGFGFSRK